VPILSGIEKKQGINIGNIAVPKMEKQSENSLFDIEQDGYPDFNDQLLRSLDGMLSAGNWIGFLERALPISYLFPKYDVSVLLTPDVIGDLKNMVKNTVLYNRLLARAACMHVLQQDSRTTLDWTSISVARDEMLKELQNVESLFIFPSRY
jgi:hypothetical protein